MAKQQVSFKGSLKTTQETLSKFGVENVSMLKNLLETATTSLTTEEKALVEKLRASGINSVADFEDAKERNTLVSQANESIIAKKEETIKKLEADIKYLEDNATKFDAKQKETIKELKAQVYSLRGQRGYLANKVKELEHSVDVLKMTLALQEGINKDLADELDLQREQSAAGLSTANRLQADLAIANTKVKNRTKTAAIALVLAASFVATTVISGLGWANASKKGNALEKDFQAQVELLEKDFAEQVEALEDERDEAVSKLNAREKQLYNILDRTITNFVLTESMVFADQNLQDGQTPNKITIFGDDYNINVSELGKAYLSDDKDDQITMDYFADLTDGLEFVNGYANEYLPMQISDLESDIETLTKELEDIKQNPGVGSGAQETIDQLNTRIAELEAELEAVRLNSAEVEQTLHAEIEDLNKEIDALTNQVETAEQERDKAEEERDAIQAEKDALQNRYDILNEKYEEAIANGNVSETTVKALAEKLSQTEAELAQVKSDLTDAQAELTEKDEAYADLLSDYNKLQSDLTEKETTIASLEAKVSELEAKVAELEATIEDSAVKEESPSNSNTNQGTSNAPVADEKNPDSYQPEDNNNEYNKDDQPMNGR